MADAMDLAGLIGGTATGGALGLVGSLASQGVAYFNAKQAAKDQLALKAADHAHELAMAQLGANRERQTAMEGFALEDLKGSLAGLQATIADQTAIGSRVSQWVADVLGLVRPGLTLLLILCALVVALMVCLGATPQLLNPFYQFSSMASMAVAWWFGSRDQRGR